MIIRTHHPVFLVKFRYRDARFGSDPIVVRLWCSRNDTFGECAAALASIIGADAAFVKITNSSQNRMDPIDDVEANAAANREPFDFRNVSKKVYYQIPNSFWGFGKFKTISKKYKSLITCRQARADFARELKVSDPLQLRMTFHEDPLFGPENLALLESSESDPIAVTILTNFQFQIGDESFWPYFGDQDTVDFVRRFLTPQTRRLVQGLSSWLRCEKVPPEPQLLPDQRMEVVDPTQPIIGQLCRGQAAPSIINVGRLRHRPRATNWQGIHWAIRSSTSSGRARLARAKYSVDGRHSGSTGACSCPE
jgi:hypothetical protein